MIRRPVFLLSLTMMLMACAPSDDSFSPASLPTPTLPEPGAAPAIVIEATPSDAGRTNSPIEGAIYGKVHIGEWDRRYHIVVPDTYNPANPTPVLFGFHGRGQNAEDFSLQSRLTPFAQEHGIIIVYPESVFESGYWALNPRLDRLDDVAFVDFLLNELVTSYNIDEDRIYATGLSNGGFFTQRLACDRADRFASVSSIAATIDVELMADCQPARPISLMFFHSTDDPNVFWEGSDLGYTSVPDVVDHWTAVNGCTEGAVWTELPDGPEEDGTSTRRADIGGCIDDVEVVLMSTQGGGHTWPGGAPIVLGLGLTALDFSANEVMWEFFTDHPR